MPPAKTTTATAAIAKKPASTQLVITTIDEMIRLAEILWKGGANSLPNMDKPEKVFRVILAGQEIGLSPTQALDTIMLCNGKTTVYGDGAMAIVLASGILEFIDERIEGQGDARVAVCEIQRKGLPRRTYRYSVDDAKTAELWPGSHPKGKEKDNWKKYPERMLTMRARGFAFRDNCADVLRGIMLWEEVVDSIPDPNVVNTKVTVVSSTTNGVQATGSSASASPSAPDAKQLPAASESPAAIASASAGQTGGAVAGPANATSSASSSAPDPTAPVTHEQLQLIADIRKLAIAGHHDQSDEGQRQHWLSILAPYGVQTARDFTSEQAAAFIATEGPKHDPFRYPKTADSVT